jgi:hypothetical protein
MPSMLIAYAVQVHRASRMGVKEAKAYDTKANHPESAPSRTFKELYMGSLTQASSVCWAVSVRFALAKSTPVFW